MEGEAKERGEKNLENLFFSLGPFLCFDCYSTSNLATVCVQTSFKFRSQFRKFPQHKAGEGRGHNNVTVTGKRYFGLGQTLLASARSDPHSST